MEKRIVINTTIAEKTYKGLETIARRRRKGLSAKASKGRAIDYLVEKELAGASKTREA